MEIAIVGGSGFVGRELTRQLLVQHKVIWLSRRDAIPPSDFSDNVSVHQVDYNNVDNLAEVFSTCQVVINLVGILHQTSKNTFEEIHHQLPKRIVTAAARANIKHYLHMGALGAEESAPSEYLRTKFWGEKSAFKIAKENNIRMLSFRPSIIFGKEDNFFNQFAALLRFSPIFPVICPNALFQPVSVADVAKAFVWGITSDADARCYELVGKEVLSMRQCIQRVCDVYGWKRLIIPLPDWMSRLQAKGMGLMPNPVLTYDNYLSLQKPNTSNRWDWDEMDITPKAIEIGR